MTRRITMTFAGSLAGVLFAAGASAQPPYGTVTDGLATSFTPSTIPTNGTWVEFGGIGAKSYYDTSVSTWPGDAGSPDPNRGWTHTSNWGTFELAAAATMRVTARQKTGTGVASDHPAVSVWKYDGSGCGSSTVLCLPTSDDVFHAYPQAAHWAYSGTGTPLHTWVGGAYAAKTSGGGFLSLHPDLDDLGDDSAANEVRTACMDLTPGKYMVAVANAPEPGFSTTLKVNQVKVEPVTPESCLPPPPVLDHFQCYAAKPAKGVKFVKRVVSLWDQFKGVPVHYEITGISKLCNPVDKNGEGIVNPDAHLVCYKLKRSDPGNEGKFSKIEGIRIDNQFGGMLIDVTKEVELCLPSSKTLPSAP